MHDQLPAAAGADRKTHYEDIEIGRPISFGHKVVTKDEIIAFGRAYDPQPMHTDEEAARATPVGGLCASGWHTCAMMMRMLCDGLLHNTASLGAPGVEEVRWIKPVRPGDVLTCRQTYTEKRDLASRPDVGFAKVLLEALDGRGDLVSWWRTTQFSRKRRPGVAAAPADTPKQPRRALVSLWDVGGLPASAPEGFLEDRQIGEMTDLGRHTFTREEIIHFARQFDPQPFHLDDAAAKASLFGALCASGWHTASIFIRQVIRHRLARAAAPVPGERRPAYGPSAGFRDLLWPRPVYVGDTIEFRARVAEKIDLKSRPNRGILVNHVQGRNQKGELVFAVNSQIMVDRREPYRPVEG